MSFERITEVSKIKKGDILFWIAQTWGEAALSKVIQANSAGIEEKFLWTPKDKEPNRNEYWPLSAYQKNILNQTEETTYKVTEKEAELIKLIGIGNE